MHPARPPATTLKKASVQTSEPAAKKDDAVQKATPKKRRLHGGGYLIFSDAMTNRDVRMSAKDD